MCPNMLSSEGVEGENLLLLPASNSYFLPRAGSILFIAGRKTVALTCLLPNLPSCSRRGARKMTRDPQRQRNKSKHEARKTSLDLLLRECVEF